MKKAVKKVNEISIKRAFRKGVTKHIDYAVHRNNKERVKMENSSQKKKQALIRVLNIK
jgi:hypothetical protein